MAPTPRGPWTVSDKRPPDIDQVPPSAPVYNTRYVYVYQSTPEMVYVGYLPGYTGHVPVLRHRGLRHRLLLPAVHRTHACTTPRPVTFGFNVVYNPWVGFGFGYGYGSPFFYSGMRFGPSYGPGWWGPPGYRPFPPPYPGGWYRPPPGYRPRPRRPSPSSRGRRPRGGARPPPPRPPGQGGGWSNNIYARPENRARNADRVAPVVDPARAPPGQPAQQRLRRQEGQRVPAERRRLLGPQHVAGVEAAAARPARRRRSSRRPARHRSRRRVRPPARPTRARPPGWGGTRPPGSGAASAALPGGRHPPGPVPAPRGGGGGGGHGGGR